MKMKRFLTLIMMPCALVLGATLESLAIMPSPKLSTNTLTGEVTTNFYFGSSAGQVVHAQAREPSVASAGVYRFWCDVKDYANYGVPHLLKNDPVIVSAGALGVLALAGISVRSFRRNRKQKPEIENREPSTSHKVHSPKPAQPCRTETVSKERTFRRASRFAASEAEA